MFTVTKSTQKFLSSSLHLRFRCLSTTAQRASQLSSLPKVVQVSEEEKAQGTLTWKNLELANRALHHDGLVVLENAISHDKLDFLNAKMVEDAKKLQARNDESPYNYNKGFALPSPHFPFLSLSNPLILTTRKQHPTRPALNQTVLRQRDLLQPPFHRSHILNSRTTTKIKFHLRQQRAPTLSWRGAQSTTHAFRR